MTKEIGTVTALFRYPVKSMAGESLTRGELGWHGLDGDRRFAFRRLEENGGFPWLTAGRLPGLLRYRPVSVAEQGESALPTHVHTPDGKTLPLSGAELQAEIAALYGKEVQLMRLNHGIFDEAAVSLISEATIAEVARECGKPLDVRRFRPNLLIQTTSAQPFVEDNWVGGVISFGDDGEGPELSITLRDVRCAMLNLDPDTAQSDPVVLKTVVRGNANCAGVYAAVTKTGVVTVGQKLYLKS